MKSKFLHVSLPRNGMAPDLSEAVQAFTCCYALPVHLRVARPGTRAGTQWHFQRQRLPRWDRLGWIFGRSLRTRVSHGLFCTASRSSSPSIMAPSQILGHPVDACTAPRLRRRSVARRHKTNGSLPRAALFDCRRCASAYAARILATVSVMAGSFQLRLFSRPRMLTRRASLGTFEQSSSLPVCPAPSGRLDLPPISTFFRGREYSGALLTTPSRPRCPATRKAIWPSVKNDS